MECDVLVIGAGPAGSGAAYAAAKAGARVVMWESKREVGIPIRSSGAMSAFLMPLLPFEVPKELLLWRNNEVDLFANDVVVRRRGGVWSSYAINRHRFDQWLARKAVEAGAELRLETELVDLEMNKNFRVARAKAKTKTGEEVIEPNVLIAADGADSMVSRRMGVRKDFIMGRGLVYEFRDVMLTKADADQIFFGGFVPGGYAHIFPTSENTANVGVGSISKDVDLERCFREFCWAPEVKWQLQNAKITAEMRGEVPFGYPIEKRRYGNVLFAGDAAGQNMKPLVEGFLPAIICGNLAGEAAAEHAMKGASLDLYEENLRGSLGPLFSLADEYIKVLVELSGSREEQGHLTTMGLCSGVLSVYDFEELKGEGYRGIKRRIEDWNASGAKQITTDLLERIWAYYLRILKYKKLFKFED